MTKTKLSFASIPLLLALAVIGCGGGGSNDRSSGTTTAKSADAFVGTWEGTYATQALSGPSTAGGTGTGGDDTSRHGTMRIVIQRAHPADAFVGIEGTAVDTTEGNATVTGIIHDGPSSENDLFLAYSGNSGDNYIGAPTKVSNGHLVGPIYLSLGDGQRPTDLDLAPVTP